MLTELQIKDSVYDILDEELDIDHLDVSIQEALNTALHRLVGFISATQDLSYIPMMEERSYKRKKV